MKSSTASATPQSSPTSQMSVTCPTTLEEIPVTNISYNLTRENCNGVLMGSIMKRARAAQANWKELTFSERAQHIQSIKQQLITKKHEVAKAICLNAGKTPVDAMATEVLPAILGCDWYAANSEKHLKEERISTGSLAYFNKMTSIKHLPVGVVLICSPWNYPFAIPFGEIIMGLMAGNAIVLKVAAQSAHVGQAIEKLINNSTLPKDLFFHVVGSGPQVLEEALKGGIDKIFFTGSVIAGKEVMKKASDTLTPVCLELGGNDPMLILEDADLERAANCALWAGCQNAGQSCAGIQRIYVQETAYDRFLAILSEKIATLRHGITVTSKTTDLATAQNGVDIGSITTKAQFDLLRKILKDATDKGAKIVAQSIPAKNLENSQEQGYFIPATVLTNVKDDMLIMQEETFGPFLTVCKFAKVEEGLKECNRCNLALTSSVWTKDVSKGKKIAEKMEAGATTVNNHLLTHGFAETAWGGWKQSGIGRTHGPWGLKEMCNAKTINWDILDWMPREFFWFPFSSTTYEAVAILSEVFGDFSTIPKNLSALLTVALPYYVKVSCTNWKVPNGKVTNSQENRFMAETMYNYLKIFAILLVLLIVIMILLIKIIVPFIFHRRN